jgi:hypothetical protein
MWADQIMFDINPESKTNLDPYVTFSDDDRRWRSCTLQQHCTNTPSSCEVIRLSSKNPESKKPTWIYMKLFLMTTDDDDPTRFSLNPRKTPK